ncbi:MAG: hypothetical protein K6G58_05985 [Lachnospiraceae bacterium]|nr:hypothetical protein [Lachnospiraceae bacterium]
MMRYILPFPVFYILAYYSGAWGEKLLGRYGAFCRSSFRIAFGGCITVMAGGLLSLIPLPVNVSFGIVMAAAVAIAASGYVAGRRGRKAVRPEKDDKGLAYIILCILSATLIAFQIYAACAYRFEGTEAIRPVRTAAAVYEGAHTFFGDPMMVLVGTMSSVMRMHPLEFVYTVMPPVFIVFYYVCYMSVFDCFLTGAKKPAALLASALLSMWGYQSAAQTGMTMLLSWFSLPAFAVHAVLGTLAVILTEAVRSMPEDDKGRLDEEDDPEEEWDMKKHRIVNARNLAIALGALAVLLIAAVAVLNSKINRLYAVTVGLQEDMKGTLSVYEYIGADGKADGYLLNGSDGEITFVGGGGSENTDSLKAFFDTYGNAVDKWYVYGEGDEDSGAMRSLVKSGAVSAGKIYVIGRKELKEL